MSKEREQRDIFDSMPPSSGAADDSQALSDSGDSAFDPFKSQHLTVSPQLRRELSAAKLPRLDPEFFQDTLAPDHNVAPLSNAPPTVADGDAASDTRPPASKRGMWVLVLTLFIACVAVTFVSTRRHPPARRPSTGTSEREHVPGQAEQPAVEASSLPPIVPAAISVTSARPEQPSSSASVRPPESTKRSSQVGPRASMSEHAAVPSAAAPRPADSDQVFWTDPR